MSRSSMKKEAASESEKFADLYRDMRGQFVKAGGKLHKVVLRHVRVGGKDGGDQDVSQWDAEHFEGKEPNEFTAEVIADIYEDAKIFPGGSTQRYGIFFWKTNTTTHSHRLFILAEGTGAENSGDVFESEGANDQGRMSQIMRHDEGYTRLALQSLHNTMQSKDKMIETFAAMNQTLMAQLVPTLTAVQDILDRQAARDFKLERDRKLYELLDEGGGKLMQVAPFIAAHLMKGKNPDLAQMILKSVSNPASDIVRLFMSEVEKNPDKGGPIFQAISALPNGNALIQALGQLHAQQKAEEAQEAAKQAAKQQTENKAE